MLTRDAKRKPPGHGLVWVTPEDLRTIKQALVKVSLDPREDVLVKNGAAALHNEIGSIIENFKRIGLT